MTSLFAGPQRERREREINQNKTKQNKIKQNKQYANGATLDATTKSPLPTPERDKERETEILRERESAQRGRRHQSEKTTRRDVDAYANDDDDVIKVI